MNELVLTDVQNTVATVTINRPEARNALSIDLLHALHAAVSEIGRMPQVSVVVFTGAGKSFCAGMDLKAVLGDPDAPLVLLTKLAELCIAIRALPAVTVAKVNGAAIGGGCGLSTVCDMSLTHADSKMGFPEVDLGVCPAVVAPWLVRKIGAGPARSMLLRGGTMTGAQAHAARLVDHVVPTLAELDTATKELTDRLSTGGPEALRATKRLLNQLDDSLNAELSREAAELSARVLKSPEAQEMLGRRK